MAHDFTAQVQLFAVIVFAGILFVNVIKSEELKPIKNFFFLYTIFNFFFAGFLFYAISINHTGDELGPIALAYTSASGLGFIYVLWHYAAYLLKRTLKVAIK